MKLFFMRHATAEIVASKPDAERVLTDRGKQEAAQAGEFLRGYRINKILVSYVKRTIETANIILENNTIGKIEEVTELYEGKEEDVLNLIADQGEEDKNILIIGHNPLIYSTALSLISPNGREYETLLTSQMMPAKIIIVEFPSLNNWSDIADLLGNTLGNIVQIFTPET